MDKLNFGVIGVGEMGHRHAENLAANVPGARLVAIADVNAARTAQVDCPPGAPPSLYEVPTTGEALTRTKGPAGVAAL